ncbi:MAG: cyclic nucleotide-binding domain-containing protein, partial [Archangium sp.]|nr:cyclic nucleotide-binding domain-containing protein [Archangium sp.]
RSVVVAYARQGDVLGEMALVDDGPRSASARVTNDGKAHKIDAQEFHAMRGTFVPAAYKILRKICLDLCLKLRATNERIVASGKHRIETPKRGRGPRPDAATVEAFPSFRSMPAVVKLALGQKLEVVRVEGLTPIFAEGETNDGAYFIVEGEVTVGRNGKTLANLPAGSMFGVVACIDDGVRSASCVTTGPATLLRMSAQDFDQLFASGHRFAFQMVDLVARQLVQHLREANQMLPPPGASSGSVAKSAAEVAPLPPAAELEEQVTLAEDDFSGVAPDELALEDSLSLELELDLGELDEARNDGARNG